MVNPVAEEFKETLVRANEMFHEKSGEEQEYMALQSGEDFFVNYVYANFDVFRLLLACAGGSSYKSYMDELVTIMETSTLQFMEETGHQAVINVRVAGDKIVVLNEGAVVEEGTHEQLMDRKGLYHKLYHLQCESLEWKVNYIES